jgi:steroid delta-isomerase-like uncharacterized protein
MGQAREIAEKFYERFAAGDHDGVVQLFDPECVHVTPAGEMSLGDWRHFGEAFKRALPDAHMAVSSVVESGETVAIEARFQGTHENALVTPQGEIPASGNQIDSRFADFFRIANGRVVEHRVYWDQVGMLRQLGAA